MKTCIRNNIEFVKNIFDTSTYRSIDFAKGILKYSCSYPQMTGKKQEQVSSPLSLSNLVPVLVRTFAFTSEYIAVYVNMNWMRTGRF